jgi:hypothetical protein
MKPDEKARMRRDERWAQRAELIIVGVAVMLVLLAMPVLPLVERCGNTDH